MLSSLSGHQAGPCSALVPHAGRKTCYPAQDAAFQISDTEALLPQLVSILTAPVSGRAAEDISKPLWEYRRGYVPAVKPHAGDHVLTLSLTSK